MRNLIIILFLLVCSPCWGGVDFDGTDDFISVPDGADFTFTISDNFSICAWINPNSVTIQARNIYRHDGNVGSRPLVILRIGSDSKADFTIWDANSGTLTTHKSTNTLSINTWTHVCGVRDVSSDVLRVYIDGVEEGSGTTDLSTGTIDPTVDLRFGNHDNNGSSSEEFNGQISELFMNKARLTDSEISLLANAKVKRMPLQIQPSTLKGYWPLNDQSDGDSFDGDTAVDRSGNGNDGTGNDGANNTGLTAKAEKVLSYP